MNLYEDSVAILKYKLNDKYKFHVMDSFDCLVESERLDKMIEYSHAMEKKYGWKYQELWIKICPILKMGK